MSTFEDVLNNTIRNRGADASLKPRGSASESRKETVSTNLFTVVHALVHDSKPHTPKSIASDAGVGHGYLLKAADMEQEDVQFQTRWVGPVTRAAQNDCLIKFLAADCGGVFYRLGPAGAMDAATANSLREFGEYLSAVADATTDRTVTPEEYHRTKAQAHEAIAAILAHVEGLRVAAKVEAE